MLSRSPAQKIAKLPMGNFARISMRYDIPPRPRLEKNLPEIGDHSPFETFDNLLCQ